MAAANHHPASPIKLSMSKLTAAAAALNREPGQRSGSSKPPSKPPESIRSPSAGSASSQTLSGSHALLVVDQQESLETRPKSSSDSLRKEQQTQRAARSGNPSQGQASAAPTLPARSIKSTGSLANRNQSDAGETDPGQSSNRVIYLLLAATVLTFIVLIVVLVLIKRPKGRVKPPPP